MISLKVLDSIDISIFIMEIHDIFFLFRPGYIIYLLTHDITNELVDFDYQ